MGNTMAEWETKEHPNIVLKVRDAQIQQLYKQTWIGLTGVLVVAISSCIILWQVVPPWKLSIWLSAFTLITFARTILTISFQRKKPVGTDVNRWAKWHVVGVCASGLM
jgi:hypothetical protein